MRVSRQWIGRGLGLVVAVAAAVVAWAGAATAVPTYAARTGFTCVTCHFDPNGGGPRKDIGFLFARQRHDMTPDPDPDWESLMRLTNNLGDVFYFGTNTRALYLFEDPVEFAGAEEPKTSTFFQMQSALYTALRPHQNLGLVWSLDFNEFSGSRTRDAYGILDNLAGDWYVRAGQFRVPFGLRQDDHTSATRGGFLNPTAGGSGGVLPYDPRDVVSGLEVGTVPGSWFGSLAVTNAGRAFGGDVHTFTGKFGMVRDRLHVAVSGYDSYRSAARTRFTRWGGYGLYGWRDWTLKSEVVAGQDRSPTGELRRVLATFAEVDYRYARWLLLGLKYDWVDLDRDRAGLAAERFSGEAVLTVVPLADLRLTYRRLRPEAEADENQYLAMWHFYY